MEENNSNTINLGNNMGGAIPPVFGNSQITNNQIKESIVNNEFIIPNTLNTDATRDEITTATVTTTTATTNETSYYKAPEITGPIVQNMHLEESNVQENQINQENQVIQEKKEIIEPIHVEGDIEIPTVLLRTCLKNAKLVGKANNMEPKSEILNIEFGENGLILRTSNGKDDFECIDKSRVYSKSFKTSVDIKRFGDYIDNEDENVLRIIFHEDTGILDVVTNKGTFKFAQKVDPSTQLIALNNLAFDMEYNEMQSVDYNKFVEILNAGKLIRGLASKKGFSDLNGTYISNIFVSSDGVVMLLQENDLGFADKEIFMDSELCNLISSIGFNASTFKIGFKYTDGNLEGVMFADGSIKLCTKNILIPDRFPVEPSKVYWENKKFIRNVDVNVKVLINVIKTVLPFISQYDSDRLYISISGNNMNIKSRDKSANVTIGIVNTSNYSSNGDLILPVTNLYSILQSTKSENITMLFSDEITNCMCIKYDNYKSILSFLDELK